MDETFERIRRIPETWHYENDVLDSCCLYRFDGKFTQGVKASLGKPALKAKALFLKNEHKSFMLVKQQCIIVSDTRDSRKTLAAIARHINE